MAEDGETKTLSRDEVSELIGVRFNTVAVWRHKGLVNPPSVQGASARQSRFTADDAFALFAFHLSAKTVGVRQEQAATVSRYLRHRPGAVETLYHYWPRPITLTAYPTHDLAGFNEPTELLYDKAARAGELLNAYRDKRWEEIADSESSAHEKIRYETYNKYPIEVLFDFLQPRDIMLGFGPMTPEEIRAMEARGDPSMRRVNARAMLATTIYRWSKALQYGDAQRYHIHLGGLDYMDLSSMSVEDHLTAEAWAIQWIDDALHFDGLGGPPDSGGSPHFEVDLTGAFDKVINAYGAPTSEPRELLPYPEPVATI